MVSKDFMQNREEIYSKTASVEYRRQWGQFFTPFEIACFMSEWVFQDLKSGARILDPGAGFGVFERALSALNHESKRLEFHLFEIDKNIAAELKIAARELKLNARVINDDFIASSWDDKYDAIIANPPYYKHHYINDKTSVHNTVCKKTSFIFSVQTNIYCWFLIKALNQLKNNGRLAFIIPSEFLNANYGTHIKDYLIGLNYKTALINVNFKENVFDKAITTSLIVLIEKTKGGDQPIKFYNAHSAGQLKNLFHFLEHNPFRSFDRTELNPKMKWINYFNGTHHENDSRNLVPFSKFGRFSRGIATGANEYFTLTKREVYEYGIPEEALLPCVAKASHVKNIIFRESDFREILNNDKKVYLFDGCAVQDGNVKKYIELGAQKKVNEFYLTRNRTPWYSLEKREVSRIWVGVFGRKGLKFIWNKTGCITLTCFHVFYPSKTGHKYLDILFLYLNTKLAHEFFEKEKRHYGNGLEKFEPNDINKSMIIDFDAVPLELLSELKHLQHQLLSSGSEEMREEILAKADKLFRDIL